MSRTDDQINVSAHRLSTSSIEQAIVSHPSVAECAVCGIPDDLKGHMPFAFITLASGGTSVDSTTFAEKLFQDVDQQVRAQIGGIAALGGVIAGTGIIPKTRSGKTLRLVL